MGSLKTAQGHPVEHCHIAAPAPCASHELAPDLIARYSDWLRRNHSDAIEVQLATNQYNCHGFAFANAHGWVDHPSLFIVDDYFEVAFNQAQEQDVVCYTDGKLLTHTARVTRVEQGHITRVQSKWGAGAEISHALHDVPQEYYGKPDKLLRLRPHFIPFADSTDGVAMTDTETARATARAALTRMLDPDVYLLVGLASTPEVARSILSKLPGMQELLALGPEAGQAASDLLQRGAEAQLDDRIESIALYLLQRAPTPEAARPLAQGINARRFTGYNSQLAAEAFLASADIDPAHEDPVTVALREAENFQ